MKWLSEELQVDEDTIRGLVSVAIPMGILFWGLLVLVLAALA